MSVILKLLSYCFKLKVNRQYAIQSQLNTLNCLLTILNRVCTKYDIALLSKIKLTIKYIYTVCFVIMFCRHCFMNKNTVMALELR